MKKEIQKDINHCNFIKYINIEWVSKKLSLFGPDCSFKISYQLVNGNEEQISRNANNIIQLRNSLRKFRPFIFLPLINLFQNEIFEKEVEEFFQYIVQNQSLFNVDPLMHFLSPQFSQQNISQLINEIPVPPIDSIINIYLQIYPSLDNKNIPDQEEGQLNQVEERIDSNLKFFKIVIKYCKDFIQNQKEQKVDKIRALFNHIIIPFSEKSIEYRQLKRIVENVTDFNLSQFFQMFVEKILLLRNDFESYKSLFMDFDFIEKQIMELEVKIKQSKDKVLQDESQYEQVSNRINQDQTIFTSLQKLRNIGYYLLIKNQLQILKERKSFQYNESLSIFADQQILYFQEKQKFWQKMIETAQKKLTEDQIIEWIICV